MQVQFVYLSLPAGACEFDGHCTQSADPADALCLPAAHTAHSPPSGPVNPGLQVHAVTSELPSGASEFARHGKHVELCLAPTDTEYVPMSQSVHAAGPGSAVYLPATHSEHVSPDDPALQVQSEPPAREWEFVGHDRHVEALCAPADTEYVPMSQSVHVSDPASVLYFPATHSEHVSPSCPDEPALQAQAVETELPAREFELAGHVRHAETSFAPTDTEYVPASQSKHVSDPASALYCPAAHSEHGPPSGPVEPALQVQAVGA